MLGSRPVATVVIDGKADQSVRQAPSAITEFSHHEFIPGTVSWAHCITDRHVIPDCRASSLRNVHFTLNVVSVKLVKTAPRMKSEGPSGELVHDYLVMQ
ncbi:hypothetical protein AVEN_238577-1 [Araneus ventricosus]|uniref:Uncharacterized protein n=1 Tax=Araneus ventricosus TaxID=182803 RepID=A0A4Y2P9L7_ARAVE|nr:hypothetical protein AVEN_238577-1 [Araneus ventricosus]